MQPPAPCLPFIEERNVVGHRGRPEGLSWGFPSSEILPHAGMAAVLEVAPGQGNVTVF